MAKFAIVGAPGGVDARLATSTLFDLLGDPSLWSERYEILIRTHDGEGLADWIEPVIGDHKVVLDFSGLDSDWTVLGPTDEQLVLEAMHVGAKYLALDDGLVELLVEDEEPAVEVVPDTTEKETEKEGDEVSAEVVEPTPVQETPAEPVKRGRGRPRKNPLPDQAQGTPPKLAAAPKPPEATQLPAGIKPAGGDQLREHLIGLIQAMLADASTEQLWKFIDGARKV